MKTVATDQKLRGGYYTPEPIAHFLARWAIQTPDAQVLEPSCGDGNILEAAVAALVERGAERAQIAGLVHGVELEPQEARKANERICLLTGHYNTPSVYEGDFFAYCKEHLADKRLFDAVIGNPPFIRYQDFLEEQRVTAFYLMQRAGLHPSRLTNAWVPFLVAATLLLKDGGRLAMVVPAELLQVNYAAELRYFLSNQYRHITLVTFKKLVFAGVQQEVVLVLGERGGDEHTGIRTIELEGIDDLINYKYTVSSRSSLKEMDHSKEKWTMYFLDEAELQLLRRLRRDARLTRVGQVAEVDVGIVTGLNEFFVLTEEQVHDYALAAYMRPIVGRSNYLQGLVFSNEDWTTSVAKRAGAFLLEAPHIPGQRLSEELRRYIKWGEEQGFNLGYKCRKRNPWYSVPSVWNPQAFMLRQIHQFPKIVLNAAGATCTDTIHRVRLRAGVSGRMVAAAFLNSLTFVFSEVMGRSYGGGVLELEPNEAEQLPLPLICADTLDFDHLDQLLRDGNISAVLDVTDEILLRQGLGLNAEETRMLRATWEKLRDRRVNRKADTSQRLKQGISGRSQPGHRTGKSEYSNGHRDTESVVEQSIIPPYIPSSAPIQARLEL